MREPRFWWRPAGIESLLFSPIAALYGAVAARRLALVGSRVAVPVICIGNPTLGGAGKTPLAISVGRMLLAEGERPVFLTRGYGGREPGPLKVDPEQDGAREIGDEPPLLARIAPTIVARNRVRGARTAITEDASVVVMDDGFQNPSLHKDIAILVVDAARGVGNARVFPAGPLRAPLAAQLARAHALVVIGQASAASQLTVEARARDIAVFSAALLPDQNAVAALAGTRVLAFAGIGDPAKFFATLRASGLTVTDTRSFADHHRYTWREAKALCEDAERRGLVLVTTEKDLARLRSDAATAELARRARALPVALTFNNEAGFHAFLFGRLAAAREARPKRG